MIKDGKSKIPGLWEKLCRQRNNFLNRAEDYSKLTLPYLLQDADVTSQNGWQGVGAQATNHLANKLAQVLFPAQRSFFTLDLTDYGKELATEDGYTEAQMVDVLAALENKAMQQGEEMMFRPAMVEAFKHLIVSGNVLLYKSQEGTIQAVSLRDYAVQRDTSGSVLTLIFRQKKAMVTFSRDLQTAIRKGKQGKILRDDDEIELFTCVKYVGDGMFEVYQSAEDIPVGKKQRLRKEKLPFVVLTWKRQYGESYGRGLVEDYSGDFFVIQFLSEALARGMALMADVKYLVRPGSLTDINQFVRSGSGEVLVGVEEDIHILQLGKYADYTPVREVLNEYRQRIGQVFMMESLNRRDAERVTAYEIQRDALEVEQQQGGIYSLFASTMQPSIAMWFLQDLKGSFTSDKIQPRITTGIAALGKMAELEKLAQFSNYAMLPAQWPEPLQLALKAGDYVTWIKGQLGASFPFFKTEEEMAQETKAAQQGQAEMMAVQEATKAIPDLIEQGAQQ